MKVAPRNFSFSPVSLSLVHTLSPNLSRPDLLLRFDANPSARLNFPPMLFSNWLPALLGGALAIQSALAAIELNIDDESRCPAFQSLRPCGPSTDLKNVLSRFN